jgi:hypothetical protein
MIFVQHLLYADGWFFFFPATVPSPSRDHEYASHVAYLDFYLPATRAVRSPFRQVSKTVRISARLLSSLMAGIFKPMPVVTEAFT